MWWLEALKKELSKLDRNTLISEFERVLILSLCQQRMIAKFREMCTYFGCYTDKKYTNKLFSSFDSFDNVLPEIKEQLVENYTLLEMSSDDLKK